MVLASAGNNIWLDEVIADDNITLCIIIFINIFIDIQFQQTLCHHHLTAHDLSKHLFLLKFFQQLLQANDIFCDPKLLAELK